MDTPRHYYTFDYVRENSRCSGDSYSFNGGDNTGSRRLFDVASTGSNDSIDVLSVSDEDGNTHYVVHAVVYSAWGIGKSIYNAITP